MTSIQLRPNLSHQRQPFFAKSSYLLDFARMAIRYAFKQIKLVIHQAHVHHGNLTCAYHLHVSVQGLAGKNYPFVGFFWGHAGRITDGRGAW